ncbi:MAG: sulfite exporter TauE/SafE family protein, partial [Flavobacterium sp.]|nr:sulfite exporter TauE/SafE family protein [Flavobacterium sp.]
LAISKGNGFIRIFFLIVVGLALIRFGYDVFLK